LIFELIWVGRQEARGNGKEARGKRQEARGKRQRERMLFDLYGVFSEIKS